MSKNYTINNSIKKGLAFTLAMTMIFTTACKNDDKTASSSGILDEKEIGTKGRYVEQELKLPIENASIISLANGKDGKIELILRQNTPMVTSSAAGISGDAKAVDADPQPDNPSENEQSPVIEIVNGYKAYSSDDGVNWQEEDWIKAIKKDFMSIVYAADGKYILVSGYNEKLNRQDYEIEKIKDDGSVETIAMDWKVYNNESKEVIEPDYNAVMTNTPQAIGGNAQIVTETPEEEPKEGEETAQGNEQAEGAENAVAEESAVTVTQAMPDYNKIPSPSSMRVADNGDIVVVQNYNSLMIYDSQGKFKKAFGLSGNVFGVFGNKVAYSKASDMGSAVYYSGQDLTIYDIDKDEETTVKMPNEITNYNSSMASDNGELIIAGNGGVFKLKEDGTWEEIIGFAQSSLSMDNQNVTNLIKQGENIYFSSTSFSMSNSKENIIKLSYDADIPAPTKQLEIYTQGGYLDSAFKQAAIVFQRQHPEVELNFRIISTHTQEMLDSSESIYKDYISQSGSILVSDAVRALNTELLAGKGPDLMLIDQLPYESYMEKEVFADISDIIDEQINNGSLYENVARSYLKDGKIYAVPTSFTFELMWGDEEALKQINSIDDLIKWCDNNPGKQPFTDMTGMGLFQQLYLANSDDWTNEDGSINTQAVIKFLNDIKTLSTKESDKSKAERERLIQGYLEMMKKNGNEVNEEDMGYILEANFVNDVVAAAYRDVEFYTSMVSGLSSLANGEAVLKKRGGGDFAAVPSANGGSFTVQNSIAINAASENQELAKELIKLVLSEDIQKTSAEYYFPININAMTVSKPTQEDIERGMTTYTMADASFDMGPQQNARSVEVTVITDEAVLNKYKEYIKTLKQPNFSGQSILSNAYLDVREFFKGKKTAEEVADKLVESNKLRLSE